jgi:hypothetical protein
VHVVVVHIAMMNTCSVAAIFDGSCSRSSCVVSDVFDEEISGVNESGAVVGICEHEIDIDSALRFDGVMEVDLNDSKGDFWFIR